MIESLAWGGILALTKDQKWAYREVENLTTPFNVGRAIDSGVDGQTKQVTLKNLPKEQVETLAACFRVLGFEPRFRTSFSAMSPSERLVIGKGGIVSNPGEVLYIAGVDNIKRFEDGLRRVTQQVSTHAALVPTS